jgi:hypothetical protein
MTLLDDITHGIEALLQLAVGFVLMALGVLGIWWEKTHEPSHSTHLLAALVVALLGACIIPSIGPVLIRSLKGIVGVLLSVFPARQAPKDPT